MVESVDTYLDNVREGVAALLIAGLVYRPDPVGEKAALFALCHVIDPTPDLRIPECPICEVVGLFHSRSTFFSMKGQRFSTSSMLRPHLLDIRHKGPNKYHLPAISISTTSILVYCMRFRNTEIRR